MKRPTVIAALLVLPALATAYWPALAEALIYDRARIARGECWRLLTGHWVHYSAAHLVADGLTLLSGAVLVAAGRTRTWLRTLALTSVAVPAVMWQLAPSFGQYAGISALAMATWAHVGVALTVGPGKRRIAGPMILAVLGAKLALELATRRCAFADPGGGALEPAIPAHLTALALGVAGALVAERSWRPGRVRPALPGSPRPPHWSAGG